MAPEPTVALIRDFGYRARPGTLGRLYVNGEFVCDVLEPSANHPEHPCAQEGAYTLVLERSAKFDRELWELKDVAGRSEIKIHAGNELKETDGCPLTGKRDPSGRYAITGGTSCKALAAFHRAMGDARVARIVIQEEARHGTAR